MAYSTVHYQDQDLTYAIIASAIEVHKVLGPGLLESAYKYCLSIEFDDRRLQYQQEVAIPCSYKNRPIDCGFRLDFLIEGRVILEIESIATILPVHEAQILTYLRLMDKHVGLLINFNTPVLKGGIRRFALGAKR